MTCWLEKITALAGEQEAPVLLINSYDPETLYKDKASRQPAGH